MLNLAVASIVFLLILNHDPQRFGPGLLIVRIVEVGARGGAGVIAWYVGNEIQGDFDFSLGSEVAEVANDFPGIGFREGIDLISPNYHSCFLI